MTDAYLEHLNRAIRRDSGVKFVFGVVLQLLLMFLAPVCLICLLLILQAHGTSEEIAGSGLAIMFFAVTLLLCLVSEYVLFRVTIYHALIIQSTYQYGEKQERTEHRAKRWLV